MMDDPRELAAALDKTRQTLKSDGYPIDGPTIQSIAKARAFILEQALTNERDYRYSPHSYRG